jgi:hypothetical protein
MVAVRHEARVRVCVTGGNTERVTPLNVDEAPAEDVPVEGAVAAAVVAAVVGLADGIAC